MAFPTVPTSSTTTIKDVCVDLFGSDLYAVLPLGANGNDISGNGNHWTAIGSPTYGGAALVNSTKNTDGAASAQFASGKYFRRQNSVGSGVIASMAGKGLTIMFFANPKANGNLYRPIFDFRPASGNGGIFLYHGMGQGPGYTGNNRYANLSVIPDDGGTADQLEWDDLAASPAPVSWWKADRPDFFRVEYRRGDVAETLPTVLNLYINGIRQLPTTTLTGNILTSDTLTDTGGASDYLTIGNNNVASVQWNGELGFFIIVKRLITAEEEYRIMQAAWHCSKEGIPFHIGGAFDLDASYNQAQSGPYADGDPCLALEDSSGNNKHASFPVSGPKTGDFAVTQSPYTITRAVGSWVDDGFEVNDWVTTSGFTNGANNGSFKITAVTATVLTLSTTDLVTEAAPGANTRTVASSSYPVWATDVLGRPVISFDNQMSSQSGSTRYLTGPVPPALGHDRHGVLFCGCTLGASILGVSQQRILTYNGSSNELAFPIVGGIPCIYNNGIASYGSATAGAAGLDTNSDTALPITPCIPQLGAIGWSTLGTGRNGTGRIFSGGRASKGITANIATGSYWNAYTSSRIGPRLSDNTEGASMLLHRLMDVGRPLLDGDYFRFSASMQQYLNPTSAAEYTEITDTYNTADEAAYEPIAGHAGVRDLGIVWGGDSISVATPQSGKVTENKGFQGRFSAQFTKRIAYWKNFSIGGSLTGQLKDIDGTGSSGAALNVQDAVDWSAKSLTSDSSRAPVTHCLVMFVGTNDQSRAEPAPNNGADITGNGWVQGVMSIVDRFRANNALARVFLILPVANRYPSSDFTLAMQAWAEAAKDRKYIDDYLIPAGTGDIHLTNSEYEILASEIETMITTAVPALTGATGLRLSSAITSRPF